MYHPEASITFQCRPGYVLRGSREATCQPDGRWVPAVPKCEPGEWRFRRMLSPSSCWRGPEVMFSASFASLQVRQSFIVLPRPYTSKITKTLLSAPALSVLPCPPPPVIANATHSAELGANFTTGMSVNYSCQPGFSLLGDPSVWCTASGNWSVPYPRCAGGAGCCPSGWLTICPVLGSSWSRQT